MRYQTAPCPALNLPRRPSVSTARGRASYGVRLGSVNLLPLWLEHTALSLYMTTSSLSPGRLIDGKAIAQNLKQQVRAAIDALVASGARRPGLAVVLVGSNPASEVYVRNKRRSCEEVGVISVAHDLPASASEAELLALLAKLNDEPSIDGILVQLPLPPQIRGRAVIEAIDPSKDVDGLHPYNLGRLAQREPLLRACTPYGVIKMLQHIGVSPSGMDAVVVGASSIVGRPMALELLLAGATTTVCHTQTRNLESQVARAELLVVAVGKPQMVLGAWIRPGAVVIDIGIHRMA